MKTYNHVRLMGYLGHKPEVFEGKKEKVTVFSLATQEKFEQHQWTEWHRIVAFGKTGALCAQYLDKGELCLVEGEIHYYKYKDRDEHLHWRPEIIAREVIFLNRRSIKNAN